MINAEALREAEQRRLAWRCRRGLLELDIVLQRFVNAHFNTLSLQEVEVFDGLLDLPDNTFWDLISAGGKQENQVVAGLVAKLNASNGDEIKDS